MHVRYIKHSVLFAAIEMYSMPLNGYRGLRLAISCWVVWIGISKCISARDLNI